MPAHLSRRQLLRATGGVALGAAATGSLAAARPPQQAEIGDPVTGPLASTYRRYGEPRGIVLGQVGDPVRHRAVTWQTTGSVDPGTGVRWAVVPAGTDARSLTADDLPNLTTGRATFAPAGLYEDDTDETIGIEGEHPSLIHRAVLELEPGATVAYAVGGSGLWSDVAVLRPAPAGDAPWTFTHIGDHGTTVASRRTTAELARRGHDLHLVAGDISYADGYQPLWDRWANEVEPLTRSVPLITAPGNHESKDYFGESYRKRFARPNPTKNWFSFTQGRVAFFSTSAGAFLGDTNAFRGATDLAEELVQMELALADAARRRAAGEVDAIIVTQHFPLWTNHDTRGPISPAYVIAQEHVLQRWQVDLVLVGHDHMYQRSLPIAYGVPTGVGPEDGGPGYTQVVAGSGGKSLYDFVDLETFDLPTPPPTDPTAVPGWAERQVHRRGPWTAVDVLAYAFVEYEARRGRLDVRAWAWPDFTRPDGTFDYSGADSGGDAVDPGLPPQVVDEFTVRTKDPLVAQQAARQPVRDAATILAGVPEARGELVLRERDDCTRHRH
jgi:acid phosphatase type 7